MSQINNSQTLMLGNIYEKLNFLVLFLLYSFAVTLNIKLFAENIKITIKLAIEVKLTKFIQCLFKFQHYKNIDDSIGPKYFYQNCFFYL